MKQTYCIGDFLFRITSETDLIIPDMFRKFESELSVPVYSFRIETSEQIPEITEGIIARRPDILVCAAEKREKRLLGIKGIPGYYAFYSETASDSANITIDSGNLCSLHIDPVFTSLLALERHMMKLDQFVLHCAYVRYQGEAILFSAPSETGKTTQANLWEKYRETRTINGDRALLSFSENRLMANGWPICGSSEVCENERTPVRAIVMLSQGKENRIRKISGREAFTLLYSQITVNSWNQEFMNRAMDFIERIMETVPIYQLSCTISEEAVEVLEQELLR